MSPAKPLKLTALQREVLALLAGGAVMTIDRSNSAKIGDRPIHFQTRCFLTDNRLVERLDKSKSVETNGNGFVISEKGRKALHGEA